MFKACISLATLACLGLLSGCALSTPDPFTDHADIGTPSKVGPGSMKYDAFKGTLRVTGSGANVWAKEDDMQFVWKKVSGDNLTFAANIAFDPATDGAIEHRKAVLMIRQSLDKDSAYADACVHGNGMTALQWRDAKGEISYELEANADAPKRMRIEKRGNYFSMAIGTTDADMKPAGGACRVDVTGDYYVGVGVCSHSVTRFETASFSNLAFGMPPSGPNHAMVNTLEIYMDTGNRDRRVVWTDTLPGTGRFEAPNWMRDNTNTLLFNEAGKLYKVPAILPSTKPTNVQVKPELVDTGVPSLNNDHVISFDNTMIGLSGGRGGSSVYTVPLKGGTPTRITTNSPSYFHGWSPDGKTLVFAAPRNPNTNSGNWDIYSIPAAGGAETRLTTDPAREDGPEYSPDGQYVYFNSARTGRMQIWRMRPDGSEQEQVTKDDLNNWFPHISPNGQKMVFISYPGSVAPDNHDAITDVQIRLMTLSTKAVTTVAKIYGGQGTINVPSWSPDSTCFAFVSYQPIQQ